RSRKRTPRTRSRRRSTSSAWPTSARTSPERAATATCRVARNRRPIRAILPFVNPMGELSVSRVDETQQKSAADAERLQKQQDRQTRDAKKSQESQQKFGDLVKAGVSKQQQAQEGQLSKELSRQQGQEA